MIGLPAAAVRSDDPVVFFELKSSLAVKGPPRRRAMASSWLSRVVRAGDDITLVALAALVPVVLEAARRPAEEASTPRR
ncbi:hypothetical protein [Streptomyces europaeiscabiei]|uniref:hypothetical protein n=1 Tax=Streptomyces europaeiscabiei TaxID=146819 RepID=UPI002E140F78|nr:hypothetical protein OHB30_09030 [Streptomyces europaeiscabiei]